MQEHTLSIIKPDITKRNLIGKVNSYFEDAGLKIVAQKMVVLTKEQAETFYAEHNHRPFFSGLIDFITSGPVVLQVLQGEGAIAENRRIMGATDPSKADEGTIRKDLALSIDNNSVHGSDSIESAKREIELFFSKDEIFQ